MLCDNCNGKGYEVLHVEDVRVTALCPRCHGQCVIHCCEGEQANGFEELAELNTDHGGEG